MPDEQPLGARCSVCDDTGRVSGTLQGASGYATGDICPERACRRRALGARPHAARRELERTERAAGDALAAALRGGTNAPVIIGVLPVNERALVPVPGADRSAFAARLAALLAAVPVHAERAIDVELRDAPAEPLVVAACTLCAGACCTSGSGHAFLDGVRLRQAGEAHGWTPAETVQQYLVHVPGVHYAASCLYHARTGCALPRVMRSETCNRYTCGGLTQLRRASADAPGDAVTLMVAADWGVLRRAATVHGAEVRAVEVVGVEG